MKQLSLTIWIFLALTCVPAWADMGIDTVGCGHILDLKSDYGPFDYTDPTHVREKLPVVENYHFSTNVQLLIRGDSGTIWGDLQYILRTFPNHHGALSTMVKYRFSKKRLPPGEYRIECYFARALKFKPDDAKLYIIYAQYIHKSGDLQKALKIYKKHEKMKPKSVERDYNLGLLYVEMKDYEQARTYAKKVYSRGYPFTELKEKLTSAGQWRDDEGS